MVVERGLIIAIREGFQLLQVDGDSQVVIQCIQKLSNEKPVHKIVHYWRFEDVVSSINGLFFCIFCEYKGRHTQVVYRLQETK